MIKETKYTQIIKDAKGPLYSLNKVKSPNYTSTNSFRNIPINRSCFTKKMQYDFSESYRIADTECFVSTTINKKRSLILKEGYKLISKNTKDVEYLNKRLNEIGFVTGYSLDKLLNEVVTSLLHNHNAFIYISRGTDSSTGNKRAVDGNKQPIAGFFPLAEAKVKLIENEYNEVIGYRYDYNTRVYNVFEQDEIIHIPIDKKPTLNIGTPPLEAVKDDILSLRQIEESLEQLIYKMTVPLIHATIGSDKFPAGIDQSTGRPETDVVNEQLLYMEDAGGITTTHRVNLKMLGAESQALRLDGPLQYYKNRVLVGLIISDVDLGTGTTTTGGAADVISEALQQNIEMYQKVIEDVIVEQVLTPLLLEKPQNVNKQYLNDSEKVKFKFNNTNLDSKIKTESHYINEFNSKLITREEYRALTGREPLTVGEKDDIFDDLGLVKESDQLTMQLGGDSSVTTVSQSSNPTSNYTNPTNQHTKNKIVDSKIQQELNIRQYVDCLLLNKFEMANSLLSSKMITPLAETNHNKIEDNKNEAQSIEATVRSLTTVMTTYIMPNIKDHRVLMDTVERFIIRRVTK